MEGYIMDITNLAQYGLAGVCISLVVAIIILVKALLKFLGNHMNHNTKALTKLCEKIDQDIEIGKETRKALFSINKK